MGPQHMSLNKYDSYDFMHVVVCYVSFGMYDPLCCAFILFFLRVCAYSKIYNDIHTHTYIYIIYVA